MTVELCYYPTTIIGVDDDPTFLNNFSLALDPDLAFRRCPSASKALDIIAKSVEQHRDLGIVRQYQDYAGRDIEDGAHAVLVLDLSNFWKRIYRDTRFEEISVAIVDYAMPEMDGLAFCRKLSGTRIKKIMLTGRMNEPAAIEALNEGVIDGFVRKSDRDATQKVVELVRRLQKHYLRDVNLDLHNLLSKSPPAFLQDDAVMAHVGDAWRERNIAEYYLSLNPPGFVAVSRSGEIFLLIVMAASDFAPHEEIVRDMAGPPELLERLESREAVPYFWRSGGYYDPSNDWHDQLFDSVPVVGDNGAYAVALISNPQAIVRDDAKVLSYDRFLEVFDSKGAET